MKLSSDIVERVRQKADMAGSKFLVAMSIDYPEFYGIPMEYYNATRGELRKAGFKFRTYFLGPRHWFGARSTLKPNATGFRVVFYEI